MKKVYIINPLRTAIATFNGSLKEIPAPELGAKVVSAVIKKENIDVDSIDTVIMGQVVQGGSKMNPARQAAILGGLPPKIPAMTVNRVCGSGAQAIVSGFLEIVSNHISSAIVGGMENMDLAPYILPTGRYGARMGDVKIFDAMLHDGLNDAFTGKHSGLITESLVIKYNISRQEQDEWAFRSQSRFSKAQEEGKFNEEIIPIELKAKNQASLFAKDEHNRPDTTLEKLAKLRPAFKEDGTITAGNAPGLNTGASAMLLADEEYVKRYNLTPSARIVSYGIGGVEPEYFGLGPIPAIQQAILRANWILNDVQRFEINEAFAAIVIAINKELKLNPELVNVEGGAIAHGHPIGATGSLLTTRLIHSMKRDGLTRGIVSMCIGGGQGIAIALEIL